MQTILTPLESQGTNKAERHDDILAGGEPVAWEKPQNSPSRVLQGKAPMFRSCVISFLLLLPLVGQSTVTYTVAKHPDANQDPAAVQATENAITSLRTKAEQGDASCQSALGFLYIHGVGIAKDCTEAAKWFRKAAEQNLAEGQANLGKCYAFGEGVERDYAEAAKWLRKAAEQGIAQAQNNLGGSYAFGEGVQQDYVQAYAWINIAAARGDKGAVKNRSTILKSMTPSQIEEGQRLSREYAEKIIKK